MTKLLLIVGAFIIGLNYCQIVSSTPRTITLLDNSGVEVDVLGAHPAHFGELFGQDVAFEGTLVATDPAEACYPLNNPGDIAGKIAIVLRGTCSFNNKAYHAERAGAIGMILMDNQAQTATSMLLVRDNCLTESDVTIPVVFLFIGEATTLNNYMTTYPDLKGRIASAGNPIGSSCQQGGDPSGCRGYPVAVAGCSGNSCACNSPWFVSATNGCERDPSVSLASFDSYDATSCSIVPIGGTCAPSSQRCNGFPSSQCINGTCVAELGRAVTLIDGNNTIGEFGAHPAAFGEYFGEDVSFQSELVFSDPAEGCGPLNNTIDVVGKTVAIYRGSCGFNWKAYFAQLAGASGVIIIDTTAPVDRPSFLTMSPDNCLTESDVTIPVVMILQEDGVALVNHFETYPNIQAKLSSKTTTPLGSGPCGSAYGDGMNCPGYPVASVCSGSGMCSCNAPWFVQSSTGCARDPAHDMATSGNYDPSLCVVIPIGDACAVSGQKCESFPMIQCIDGICQAPPTVSTAPELSRIVALAIGDNIIREFDAYPAVFGEYFGEDLSFQSELVFSDPPNGCVSLNNAEDVINKVVAIYSGSCGFHLKAYFAQLAGASGSIILDTTAPVDRPSNFTMDWDDCLAESDVTIPVVMIHQEDGVVLANQFESFPNIQAKLSSTKFTGTTPLGSGPCGSNHGNGMNCTGYPVASVCSGTDTCTCNAPWFVASGTGCVRDPAYDMATSGNYDPSQCAVVPIGDACGNSGQICERFPKVQCIEGMCQKHKNKGQREIKYHKLSDKDSTEYCISSGKKTITSCAEACATGSFCFGFSFSRIEKSCKLCITDGSDLSVFVDAAGINFYIM
ncbi:unnamed protein product [Owenia fusiformis]|uniref:Uncharacterized protein n=1 Tax=Owenia fusiformis TaxID=6347 RepID=A0A8J1XP07_OWEFU|nr:unnamed protein product [Owenia fusiformis]